MNYLIWRNDETVHSVQMLWTKPNGNNFFEASFEWCEKKRIRYFVHRIMYLSPLVNQ